MGFYFFFWFLGKFFKFCRKLFQFWTNFHICHENFGVLVQNLSYFLFMAPNIFEFTYFSKKKIKRFAPKEYKPSFFKFFLLPEGSSEGRGRKLQAADDDRTEDQVRNFSLECLREESKRKLEKESKNRKCSKTNFSRIKKFQNCKIFNFRIPPGAKIPDLPSF